MRLTCILAALAAMLRMTAAGAEPVGHGGEITLVGDDAIHVFRTNGVFRAESACMVDVLVVGGGGGGGAGRSGGGGGGAGGVVYAQNLELAAGSYSIVVGSGGAGGYTNELGRGQSAMPGDPSSAFEITANGGGKGGSNSTGGKGASTGGAGVKVSTTSGMVAETAIPTQGYKGGCSTNTSATVGYGGGGGGAGHTGYDGVAYDNKSGIGGMGGDGVTCDITGETKYYGGGGGGGYSVSSGSTKNELNVLGGLGGGGNGSGNLSRNVVYDGGDGESNTGGGGGGGSGGANGDNSLMGKGGNGGSGVVIVRCRGEATAWRQRTAVDAVGGIVSRSGAYRIHTFTENGVFTMGEDAFVEILLVGGGGGGGAGALSGGGGAGGEVLHVTDCVLAAGTYSVTVGAGGQGAHTNSSGTITADLRSSAGGRSTLLFSGTVTDGDWAKERLAFYAEGGAPGGVSNGSGGGTHLKGFNGGGASAWCQASASYHAGGVTTSDRGFAGGASTNLSAVCGFSGGGGGAGHAGNDGVYPGGGTSGCGGDGVACDITGEVRYYGGGGGGGYSDSHLSGNASRNQDVRGGAGGGGNGSGWLNNSYAYPGGDGEANTGGGGGGGGACPVGSGSVKPKGGEGGSGVVILRYLRKPKGAIFCFR